MNSSQLRLPRTAAVVIGCLVAICSSPTFAQDAARAAEMNRLNEEGFLEFRAGRFAEAAQRFRAAHEAVPDPNLRKNEAIAWFKAGRCDEAMPAANSFLIAADTAEPDRLEARSILANCRVEMAREAFVTENWKLAASLLDEAESMQPDDYAMDQIAIARVELVERKSSPRPQTTAKPSPAGWIMVASGAAIVGGTLAYWLLTIPDRDASRNLSPMHPDYDAVSRRARTSRWLVPVGVIGGAALAGVGVYLVVAGEDRSTKQATAGLWYRW